MDVANIALGISNIFVGLLIIVICIPLVLGKVPMNNVYGIRFKKSFESEEFWYKINAYGGKLLIIWSIPLVFLGVVTFFLPLEGRRADRNSSIAVGQCGQAKSGRHLRREVSCTASGLPGCHDLPGGAGYHGCR